MNRRIQAQATAQQAPADEELRNTLQDTFAHSEQHPTSHTPEAMWIDRPTWNAVIRAEAIRRHDLPRRTAARYS